MAKVNPFAAAVKKAPASGVKSTRPIYVADTLTGNDGNIIYRKEEVSDAIHNYIEGSDLFDKGDAMCKTSRPIILNWTKSHFVSDWVKGGKRPENPAITNKDSGDGDHMKILYVDKSAKLDDFQFDQMKQLIGSAKAEESVIRRNEFQINPELLDQRVKVKEGNKVVEQTVMEALISALNEKFSANPEILGDLFIAKERFETKKGLIDQGLSLVTTGKTPADIERLSQFIDVIRCQQQIKPGAKDD